MNTIPAAGARVREDFGDRWNPLLVKELRQALQSRAFTGLFLVTQLVAAAVAAIVLTNADQNVGPALFSALTVCLVISAVGVVPLLAFQSFAQEWEDNTLDLLVLSDIGPGRIAAGKLQGALLQTGLLVVSFAPYLALTFFLEGVDTLLVVFAIGVTVLASGMASTLAMALGGLARQRQARQFVLALLTVFLIGMCITAIPLFAGAGMAPVMLRASEFWVGFALFGSIGLVLALLCFLAARGHLAHPEEAPTLPARAVTLGTAVLLPPLLYVVPEMRQEMKGHPNELSLFVFLLLGPALVIFATEREGVGRVALRRLRGRRWFAAAIHPLLPGGGRGLLLLVVTALALWGSAHLADAIAPGIDTPDPIERWRYAGLVLYAWIYVSTASLITWRWGENPGWRWVARLGVLLLVAVCVVGGTLVGGLTGYAPSASMRHVMNPFHVLNDRNDANLPNAVFVLAIIAFVLFLVHLPRFVRGFRNVHRAVAKP